MPNFRSVLTLLLTLTFINASATYNLLQAANSPSTASSPCETPYPSNSLIDWNCRTLTGRETLESVFGDMWPDGARFNRIDRRHARAGVSIKVPVDLSSIKGFSPMPRYYPPAANDAKFILVDSTEHFLGAYEYGQLVHSAPVTLGERGNETPSGEFTITAYHRNHRSSKYFIDRYGTRYPMRYALRFFIDRDGVAYWIHGRSMPGHMASHGCVGLYDEQMQKRYFGYPEDPALDDARTIFEWAISGHVDDGRMHEMEDGPRLLITDTLQ